MALSFAGAQRPYAEQVAAALKGRGVRVFYDADQQVRLWGTHLAEELPRIYTHESAAVVIFVSADYAGGDWTRLERRAAFSKAVFDAGVHILPARFDGSELPGLLPDVACLDLRGLAPQEFADLVAAKLADLGITGHRPSGGGHGRPHDVPRPAGAVRVAEADPRRLGVHPAISVPGVPDDVPPAYVSRDADAAEFGVHARLRAAAVRGGFVLLVGGSSVGKTRCAAEAVKALLADWWLVHPAGPAEVAALAERPPTRTVVWLDELQHYLDGEQGLTGGVVRTLLYTDNPVVIVGTLWPDWYNAYVIPPTPWDVDLYGRERGVVGLADVVRIGGQFSAAERARAREVAVRDQRLQVALDTAAGYGLTQTLAAAPRLVAHWEDAQSAAPYGWAVLTAALDAARLGARAPLAPELLRAAAVDYCTPRQQAEAPADWFEGALAYATRSLLGTVAALEPTGAGMGTLAGYTVAEYLLHHATRVRRSEPVPASTWDALVTHVQDPADTVTLARSADNRLLYRYAIHLYRRAADADDCAAADRLAERGDLGEAVQLLRARVDARGAGEASGATVAAGHAADLLAEHGDLDGLRARADAGDARAAWQLADLLAERGEFDEAVQVLRARADAGDTRAAWQLAHLLAERDDLDGLRVWADAEDSYAVYPLAHLLAERGEFDEAVQLLRTRADVGDARASYQLADLLAERGEFDEAVRLLRARADAGDMHAAEQLADLLAKRGDLDGLRAGADAGNNIAAWRLADLLIERGEFDQAVQVLRARADAGDSFAADRLADLLIERGELDDAIQLLRGRADTGDMDGWLADEKLASLLAQRADLDGLRARANTGNSLAAHLLARLLVERGEFDDAVQLLRGRADAGDRLAAGKLASLLAQSGDLDGLRARVDIGDNHAVERLADLLIERGELDEAVQFLRSRADAGDGHAACRLAGLLAQRGDLDGLRARVDAGDRHTGQQMINLLARLGEPEQADRMRRSGLNPDGSVASSPAR